MSSNRKNYLFCTLFFLCCYTATEAQQQEKISIRIDEKKTAQTIHNLSASDAWSCQFAGNWPDKKKNAIADWLFSMDTVSNGSPVGIGLSMWRYNLGAGSAEQGDSSKIKDEWRRAALTLKNNKHAQAQNWFLGAAKKRGVEQFLGFFNSPPVQLTNNGKAFADGGKCNLDSSQYKAFAGYAVQAIKHIKQSTGISFGYISPVNEPQWDWSDGGQEGCPYTNEEISELVKQFNKEFMQWGVTTKILLPEAGHIKYLLRSEDKPNRENQIHAFFNASSPHYVGNLSSVSRTVAAHSYFSTSPYGEAIALRKKLKDSIDHIKGVEYWQSEYCILGDNAGEIKGEKRDLGMGAALYVAKVIHMDMVEANASAWQWWIAISPYDYKDGLIYIDKNKTDGNYYDSKILWALGNYSRFIRPGMKRIDVTASSKEVLVSGYKDIAKGKLVIVIVNPSDSEHPVSLLKENAEQSGAKEMILFTTNTSKNLKKSIVPENNLVVPAKSVVTVVMD